MNSVRTDIRIFSILLSFISLIFAYGLNITFGRVLFTGFFIEIPLAQMFNVFAAVCLSLINRYYSFVIPIAVLGYVFPVKYISLIVFLISLTVIHTFPKYTRDVILLIDSIGLSYVLLFFFSVKFNVLMIPLALIQNVPMVVIPVLFVLGLLYSLRQENLEVKREINIPKPLLFLSPLIYLIPLTYLNVFRYPETVDWTYYYQWLNHPTFGGWFFYSRPLYLAILYLFGLFVNHTILAQIEFIPLLFIYAFSAYYLSSAVNPSIGKLGLLMALFSPMLLTFLYSGLDANLFSISLMFISIALLIRKKVLGSVLFSYLALSSHVYAWAQLEGGIIIYIIALYVLRKDIPKHLLKYVIFTLPVFLVGIGLILSGYFTVPLGDSFSNLYFQLSMLGWGATSSFVYYLLSLYGLRGTPRLLYVIIFASFIAMLFLNVVQNLVIDLPLFLPASIGLYKLREDLRFPIVLFLFVWTLYMILNSFPYMYQGVTI